MLKLRLVHTGLAASPPNRNSVLLDDLDLENKSDRRPSNKQPAYVPLVNPFDEAQPGFIDLLITDRVQASFERGRIRQAITAGWISTVLFDDTTLTPPVISNVALSAALNGTLTITGTGFLSVSPDVTALLIRTADLPVPIELQLTADEIIAAPYSGSVIATQIQFTVPITSSLGQIVRDPIRLFFSVYSDGQLSEEFEYTTP